MRGNSKNYYRDVYNTVYVLGGDRTRVQHKPIALPNLEPKENKNQPATSESKHSRDREAALFLLSLILVISNVSPEPVAMLLKAT